MTAETKIVENKENVQPNPEQNISPKEKLPESVNEVNWRQFREQREIERKEKIAAEKRAAEKEAEATALKAAMESILDKPRNSPIDQETNETEEQRISRMVKENLEKERKVIEEQQRKKEHAEFPQRLTRNYNDFDKICTSENLDYLEFHYPEVAAPFKHLPDSYEKWEGIYKAVKRFVSNPDSRKDAAKAEANFNKPKAMAAPGVTSTGDTAPYKLDDQRRKDNWTRMQRVMRGG
jgi:hypothetical protein